MNADQGRFLCFPPEPEAEGGDDALGNNQQAPGLGWESRIGHWRQAKGKTQGEKATAAQERIHACFPTVCLSHSLDDVQPKPGGSACSSAELSTDERLENPWQQFWMDPFPIAPNLPDDRSRLFPAADLDVPGRLNVSQCIAD